LFDIFIKIKRIINKNKNKNKTKKLKIKIVVGMKINKKII